MQFINHSQESPISVAFFYPGKTANPFHLINISLAYHLFHSINRKLFAENPRQRSAISAAAPRRITSAKMNSQLQPPRPGTAQQEVYAKKRESDQLRMEANSQTANWYDKWGRITSRFENLAGPAYYEKSDQLLRRDEEEKRRKEETIVRQEKMRELMAEEKESWEKELKEQERAKVRPGSSTTAYSKSKHDVDVLQRLNSSLSEQDRRRKEIEAKLYGKWRFGMTRDDMILESKNHHQAMAKLNWLDQQVEEQLERDRSEKEFEILEMQRQSETLREEEVALEAKQLQEREVAQLKQMLEYHVGELKTREAETRALKDQSAALEDIKLALEIKQQEIVSISHARNAAAIPLHNIRRLKVVVLDRCHEVHEEITLDASQLPLTRALLRGQLMSPKEDQHFQLLACKFDQELVELQKDEQGFATMYDSEIKAVLMKQQQVWIENAETRFRLLKNLTQELKEKCDILVACNREEMASLVKIKESHLETIEELNAKLKGIIRKAIDEPLQAEIASIISAVAPITARIMKPHQQHEYSSLGEQLEGLRLAPDSVDTSNKMSDGSPRYGRKKMAWS